MFMLEARAGKPGDRMGRKAKTPLFGRVRLQMRRSHASCVSSFRRILDRLVGSEGVSDPCAARHLDARACAVRTNFHELPWKSTVEVPWQVVPGPAAQSFWPFSATPKHFSL